jgi:hypothetical protein
MHIKQQALFYRAFEHGLTHAVEADGETVDFDKLPKEALWSMLYYCLPHLVREFL